MSGAALGRSCGREGSWALTLPRAAAVSTRLRVHFHLNLPCADQGLTRGSNLRLEAVYERTDKALILAVKERHTLNHRACELEHNVGAQPRRQRLQHLKLIKTLMILVLVGDVVGDAVFELVRQLILPHQTRDEKQLGLKDAFILIQLIHHR